MEARGGVLGTPANLTAADRVRGQRLSATRSKARAEQAYAYIIPFMREERSARCEPARLGQDPQRSGPPPAGRRALDGGSSDARAGPLLIVSGDRGWGGSRAADRGGRGDRGLRGGSAGSGSAGVAPVSGSGPANTHACLRSCMRVASSTRPLRVVSRPSGRVPPAVRSGLAPAGTRAGPLRPKPVAPGARVGTRNAAGVGPGTRVGPGVVRDGPRRSADHPIVIPVLFSRPKPCPYGTDALMRTKTMGWSADRRGPPPWVPLFSRPKPCPYGTDALMRTKTMGWSADRRGPPPWVPG